MFLARFILTALFKPMFKVFLGDISWRELLFATAAGLRGSVSLILAQAVVTDELAGRTGDNAVRSRRLVSHIVQALKNLTQWLSDPSKLCRSAA